MDPDVLPYDKFTNISGLEGTSSEALQAIEATINRLNRLGATIRKYSASSLDDRVESFTRRHGDEDYTQLARHYVRCKYKTATPSLRDHLAQSMASRRQRLRYLHRHQSKLAGLVNTRTRTMEIRAHPLASLVQSEDVVGAVDQQLSQNLEKEMTERRRTHYGRSSAGGERSETNVSDFVPTRPGLARLRSDDASVVSSSNDSSTAMAEVLEDYPEPPMPHPGQPEPPCPYCCQPLEGCERMGVKWLYAFSSTTCLI